MNHVPLFESLLSFKREPDKLQVLSVTLFYADGSQEELNLSSPLIRFSEDIERQHTHIKRYLNEAARDLGLTSWHAKVLIYDGEQFKKGFEYAPVHLTESDKSDALKKESLITRAPGLKWNYPR